MIERFFNYSLLAIVLMVIGLFVNAFTFGEYTIQSALWDTFGIVWTIAVVDCIYHLFKN